MSDPTLSDIGFKNEMAWVWTTLKMIFETDFLALKTDLAGSKTLIRSSISI